MARMLIPGRWHHSRAKWLRLLGLPEHAFASQRRL